ncbi:MAG: hypothetical protein ACRCZF_20930 [Gemmataceae bacterium]
MRRCLAMCMLMLMQGALFADDWTGKRVLPKQHPSTMKMTGTDSDGEKIEWVPHNLMKCKVREDKDGQLRLHDGKKEGWIKKEEMVTAADAPAWWSKAVKENPFDAYGWQMRGFSWRENGAMDKAIYDRVSL